MKDSLKKFVDDHRSEMDHREPSDKVWGAIKNSLPVRISLWNNVILWRAAAVLFFGISGALFLMGNFQSGSQVNHSQLQGEFTDLEAFYSEQIADKVELISDIQDIQDEEFTQDFAKLEAMYQVLREQMKTHPTQQVKDALILNLLVRIDLLNQQIKNLEDSQKAEQQPEV